MTAPPADGAGIAGHGCGPAENEDIRIRDAGEAIAAAFASCFTDSITALALFWLAAKRQEPRQK